MLSRDADCCFWVGRYVERAEATARMVDVHYHAALEPTLPNSDGAGGVSLHWQTLLAISGSAGDYGLRFATENDRDILHYFAFDLDNPNSIRSCWNCARENARSIREQLASEMWESLNVFYLELQRWDVDRAMATSTHEFFNMVQNASHLFQGILNRTMLMGQTRDWLDAGRFLERGGQTARLLDVKFQELSPSAAPNLSPEDMHSWIAVLKSVSAFEMYRKTYRAGITPSNVVDFLVLHPQFPASVRHCVGRVEGCMKRISGNQREEPTTEPERLLGRLRADLTYTQPEEILRGGLHTFLESVQDQCGSVGNAIARAYLTY